jgi:hypothetical protein
VRYATGSYPFVADEFRVLIVTGVTKNYVNCLCANEPDKPFRFSRKSGSLVGVRCYPETIRPYSREIREKIRHADLVRAVSEAAFKFLHPGNCNVLPSELLLRMSAVFQEAVGVIKRETEEQQRRIG